MDFVNLKNMLFVTLVVLFVLINSVFAGSDSSAMARCHGFSIGLGSQGGGNNSAELILYNLKAEMHIKMHHAIAINYFGGGEPFHLGGDPPSYEDHELNDVHEKQEVGILYLFKPSEVYTGPYFGLGINLFRGKTRSEEMISVIGVPIEFGVNIQMFHSVGFGIGYIGSYNTYAQYNGVIFRLLFNNSY